MKIFVAHASSFNFKEALYDPLRNSVLNQQHEIILPQEEGHEEVTKELIKSCDLLIAEVSYPSTGQGIELGWADMYSVPVVCIYKQGASFSQALHYVSKKFLMYTDAQNMIEDITGVLKQYE
jgi:nucleoside 2-deoxyribosyltransferase